MKYSLRASLGALFAMVFAATTMAFAAPSGATLGGSAPSGGAPPQIGFLPLDLELLQPGQLVMLAILDAGCDAPITANQITFSFQGTPTTAVMAAVDGSSTTQFLVMVPAGLATVPEVANLLEVSITCDIGGTPTTKTSTLAWAQIDVTKVVVGDAPATARYGINVDCSAVVVNSVGSVEPAQIAPTKSINATLAAGETFTLFAVTDGTCAITETDSQGAESAVVSQPSVTISRSIVYPVTITNTFPVTPPKFTG